MTATTTSQDSGPRGTVEKSQGMGALWVVGAIIGVINAPVAFIVNKYLKDKGVPHSGLIIAGVTGALAAVMHQIVYQESPKHLRNSWPVQALKNTGIMPERMWNYIFEAPPEQDTSPVR